MKSPFPIRRSLVLALGWCLLGSCFSGCSRHAKARLPDADVWDVATIRGQRIGHSHTTIHKTTEGGRALLEVAQATQLSVARFGEETKMEIDYRDRETPAGELIDFDLTARLGATPMHTTGKVVGGRLELQVESQGQKQSHSVAWPAGSGGLLAPELSLLAKPLKPGERRTLKHLNFDGQVCATELTAEKVEPVELWSGSSRLLKIDSIARIETDAKPKPPDIKGAFWVNDSGETLKAWVDQMDMAFYRVTPQIAQAPVTGHFDLGKAAAVAVDRPIPHAHDAKWVRYRIHLEGGDPLATFPSGPSQEVKRIDAHTAEVTVRAVRPPAGAVSGAANKPAGDDAPIDDDSKPNNFIQSDDPLIVSQAKEAVGKETDPWKQALALEAYVHRVMKMADFSQAFATAADVARNRQGDCKGHAVYLAALARAEKIPARVAVGLVYMPQAQAFGGHMWTEVYIGGRWIDLDGTLGKGGIGGGHLQIAHSPLSGVSAYNVFYPVMAVLHQMKIEVLDWQ